MSYILSFDDYLLSLPSRLVSRNDFEVGSDYSESSLAFGENTFAFQSSYLGGILSGKFADRQSAPRSGASRKLAVNGTINHQAVEEPDDQRYCFCQMPSHGEMVGCDDDDCVREWVRPMFDNRSHAGKLRLVVSPCLCWIVGTTGRQLVLQRVSDRTRLIITS